MIDILIERIINLPPAEIAAIVFFSVIAMTLKEYVKALTASKFGDTSAEVSITLANPFSKISFTGICMAILYFVSWSRSTVISTGNFSDRKKGLFFCGISGLLSVLILGFIYALLIRFTLSAGKENLTQTLLIGVYINTSFFWFNLLPAPQLDGSLILSAFLPRSSALFSGKYDIGFLITFLVIFFSGNIPFLMTPATFLANLILSLALG